MNEPEKEKHLNTIEKWGKYFHGPDVVRCAPHTVNFVWIFRVCARIWVSECVLYNNKTNLLYSTNEFIYVFGTPFVFFGKFILKRTFSLVSCFPAKSKWCGFVIVHVSQTTRFYWAPFWTRTHSHTIPAVFADFVKLNKCCAILRVKIEIVSTLWLGVCSWTW